MQSPTGTACEIAKLGVNLEASLIDAVAEADVRVSPCQGVFGALSNSNYIWELILWGEKILQLRVIFFIL